MALMLYNTLSRKKELFSPAEGNAARLYTCGPTVYSAPTIGNLRAYVNADVLVRALRMEGYAVKQIMNITDVGHLTSDADEGEDKLEKAAREEKQDAYELSRRYAEVFMQNIAALRITEPSVWAKATEHIPEQIALVERIEKAGFTYKTSDGVYFDTSKLKDYGALAHLDIAGLEEGARVEKNPEKRTPTDFALWKLSPKGEKRQMEWESPWGTGFPGWHLECTAMSAKYLGEESDIHSGGVDHIPVHHTNEIAQAQAAYSTNEARFWIHNEFLLIKEGRMGKSQGNKITLETLEEKGYAPLAYRYFVLGAHYRQKLNFSWEALDGAQAAYDKLTAATAALGSEAKIGCAEFEQHFKDAVEDDLNTPRALAAMWDLLKSDYPPEAKKRTLLVMDEVLGLGLAEAEPAEVPSAVQELADEREGARKKKDFSRADELRKRIADAGFEVEDTGQGPVLKPKA